MPALSVPYYNVNIDHDWYPVAAGHAVDIPVIGWATGATAPWEISLSASEHSVPAPPTSATLSGPTVTIAGFTYHQMATDQTAMVHVAMGTAATSGTWRTFTVYSFRLDDNGADGLDGDDHDHMWRFGVYVP